MYSKARQKQYTYAAKCCTVGKPYTFSHWRSVFFSTIPGKGDSKRRLVQRSVSGSANEGKEKQTNRCGRIDRPHSTLTQAECNPKAWPGGPARLRGLRRTTVTFGRIQLSPALALPTTAVLHPGVYWRRGHHRGDADGDGIEVRRWTGARYRSCRVLPGGVAWRVCGATPYGRPTPG